MGQFLLFQESLNSIPEADVAAEDSAVSSPAESLITGCQQTAFQHHLYPHPLSNTLACIIYTAKGLAPSQTRLQKGWRLIHMTEFTGV